jgi:serine protease Do
VTFKAIRDGRIVSLLVTIGELPSEIQKTPTELQNALNGISVQNLNPDINRQLNLPEKIRGVVVTDIESDSSAASVLVPGDVILEINRKAISSLEDYENIVSRIKPEKDVLLLVYRRGSTIFVTISAK